jgi:hypothetical protein
VRAPRAAVHGIQQHDNLGIEAKTIKAILSWIRTGAVLAGMSE